MNRPIFDPKELVVISKLPANPMRPEASIYDYPCTPKENFKGMLSRQPVWQASMLDSRLFTPAFYPDNVARAMVFEHEPHDPLTQGGGKDIFGLNWEYVAQAGGSMVRPGKPLLEDANDWKEKVVFPDMDSWDWEGAAGANNDTYLETEQYINAWFMTGWYERLISFMDFEGAIMAMVDEDQTDAVTALFTELTDMYIDLLGRFFKYFPKIDGVCFHDDWGSQRETFFSPKVAQEMIVPHMQRVTKYIHDSGRFCELHSCGQLLKQVPNIIEAGWDYWTPQLMNDTHLIYEQYGDKLVIGVATEPFDPSATSEAEQRTAAKAYADKFCRPDKPSYYNSSAGHLLVPAFREELYIRSRENYSMA